jgi:hypothetical protein
MELVLLVLLVLLYHFVLTVSLENMVLLVLPAALVTLTDRMVVSMEHPEMVLANVMLDMLYLIVALVRQTFLDLLVQVNVLVLQIILQVVTMV